MKINNGRQTLPMQLEQMRNDAKARGWKMTVFYNREELEKFSGNRAEYLRREGASA